MSEGRCKIKDLTRETSKGVFWRCKDPPYGITAGNPPLCLAESGDHLSEWPFKDFFDKGRLKTMKPSHDIIRDGFILIKNIYYSVFEVICYHPSFCTRFVFAVNCEYGKGNRLYLGDHPFPEPSRVRMSHSVPFLYPYNVYHVLPLSF